MVAAVEHGSGLVLGQTQIPDNSKPGEGNRTAGTRRDPRCHARPAGNRAKPGRGLPRRPPRHRHQGQLGRHSGGPEGHRLDKRAAGQLRDARQGTRPHRTAPLRRGRPGRPTNGTVAAISTDESRPSGSAERSNASKPGQDPKKPPTAGPRSTGTGPIPACCSASSASTGTLKAAFTTFATGHATRTVAGRMSATRRATSPA